MKTISCVIVEPQPLFLRGALADLEHEEDIEVVAYTDQASEGIDLVSSCSPDVAVIGLRSHEMEALGVLEALRDMYGTHVIVLTADVSEPVVYQSMVAGAHGYMLKRAVDNLADAIRRVQAGEIVMCATALKAFVGAARSGNHRVRKDATDPLLSPREKQVLTLIARGYDRNEIANQLGVSVNTVKTHLGNAYAKLGVNRQAPAIQEAIKQGQIDGVSESGGPGSGEQDRDDDRS